ncbi:hypothetical protein F2Q69_00025272 [Brassica cretica]|uniref:Alpha/beta hydrolase fold-3 domain-containing protein n=1 Tax=Brassica cretica TaxID=69181 RepID=A0A8S9QHB2_BRACR|nr:hypothetical protein F2Q69_00025272 [Brassica cretica]
MRFYVPTSALRSSQKLPLVVFYHGGGFIVCSVDFKLFHDFCNLMARELNVPFVPASSRAQTPGGLRQRTRRSEWCEPEIRHENDNVFPPTVGDLCWELCLPVGANRDHEFSNPTVGDGSRDYMRKIQRLGWKVMVCGGGDPMVDRRQRGVANLFKEKGVDVVERFTTDDGFYGAAELGDPSKSQALLASIKNFISSHAPLYFSLKSIPLKEAKLLTNLKD